MNENTLILLLTALLAALAAALITWLLLNSRQRRERETLQHALDEAVREHQAAREQLTIAETTNRQLPPLREELAASREQIAGLQQQAQQLHSKYSAAEQKIADLYSRENEYACLKDDYRALQEDKAALQIHNERLQTQFNEAKHAHQQQLAQLTEVRQSLADQFQNLANNILEEKSKRFTEHNHESINRLLSPLNERMGKFSELVQNTYEKEAKERLTLENELKRLQALNTQLHSDAKALTDALAGTRNKTQGNWGEMILETVLENSGLVKGREYIVQAAASRREEDGSTRRLQPDVLVNLPDNKQIIIDSKVSLTAYVRYTQAQTPDEAERELAAHTASIRSHIKSLSLKQYSELDGVNTLDFVFMFIPVEPAYLLALQHDHSLFQECFDKRIMLVGPSTLLATLRTVANIWRNEQQNQNALTIADEGGKLYDKFVGFMQTFESVGKNIEQAQNQYQAAFKQLSEGRGNLVNRAQKLQQLGVKASKQLDKALVEQAQESAKLGLSASEPRDESE